MRSMLILGSIVSASLAASLMPAIAGKASLTREAADRSVGMALLGAHVYGDGTFNPDHSSGLVSVKKIDKGQYDVTFNRSRKGCTPAGTPINQDRLVVLGTTTSRVSNHDTWIVYTRQGSVYADSDFMLLIFCSR